MSSFGKTAFIFFLAFLAVVLSSFEFSQARLARAAEPSPAPRQSFEDILAQFSLGRYEKVVKDLPPFRDAHPGADPGQADFLMAMALYRSGQFSDAVAFYQRAEALLPRIADAAALYRTRALEKAGRYREALDAFADARSRYPSSPFFRDADEWTAKLTGLAGDYASAAAMFRKLADARGDGRARAHDLYEAGRLFEKAGSPRDAVAAWRDALDAKRADHHIDRALAGWARLSMQTFGGAAPESYKDFLARWADAKFKANDYDSAQAAFEALRDASGGSLDGARRFQLGTAAFYNHDDDAAAAALAPIAADPSSDHAEEAAYRLGKIATRKGDNDASRAVFENLLRRFPKGKYTQSARYQIALLDIEDSHYKKACAYFADRVRKPSGKQRSHLVWLLAWTAYRSGKLDVAERTFTSLMAGGKSSDFDRYAYWRGCVRQERKDAKGALSDWNAVNKTPLTYYGILAGEKLKSVSRPARTIDQAAGLAHGDPRPPADPAAFPPGAREQAERCLLLARFGCVTEASLASEGLIDLVADNGGTSLSALRLLQMSGRYHLAMRMAGIKKKDLALEENGVSFDEVRWGFRYPRAYPETVLRYAEKWNLPPSLLWGVMRSESMVQSDVVSRANAIGLMQIVPRTAEAVARELGDADFDPDDLFDPEISIRYAAWYLRTLMNRFDGNLACAVAAYNGGPDMVAKLWKEKSGLPAEVFVEEIPYRETGDYVKKVNAAERLYRILYERPEN